VKAVIAESYERIHRSNLVGMGILPLRFKEGETPTTLGLTGRETFSVEGSEGGQASEVEVIATPDGGGDPIVFTAEVLLQTPREREYFRHGGILPYALRRLAAGG
jgi:aconitate hydratase